MYLDDAVEQKFYIILFVSLIIYLLVTMALLIQTKANYLMDNIKHSYTETFDNYDLSDGY